jgi:hypothetical protein
VDAAGQLTANGQALLTVPLSEWFHVDILCGLGRQATGTYILTVTRPGQAPQTFPDQPCGHPQFRQLRWLGFISLATEKAVFYLDNVQLAETEE